MRPAGAALPPPEAACGFAGARPAGRPGPAGIAAPHASQRTVPMGRDSPQRGQLKVDRVGAMLARSVLHRRDLSNARSVGAAGCGATVGAAAARPPLIVAQIRGTTVLLWDGDAHHEATVAKKLKVATDAGASLLAVGDRVAVEREAGALRIIGIEPRQSILGRAGRGGREHVRVVAANADQAVIVSAAADPPFRPGLVDRWALLAMRGGLTPVLCLNKLDLISSAEAEQRVREAAIPLEAIFVSALTGEGLPSLRARLKGRASVLVGHSGVGKSALLARLFPGDTIVTGDLSARNRKGRHTTTSARMYTLPEGGYVVDTPGVRTVPLGSLHVTEIAEVFPEIHGAPPCRFRACSHRVEPGCEVRARVESGGLPAAVYRRYLRLLAEVEATW
jgi:ribosome biogenesis GTPase